MSDLGNKAVMADNIKRYMNLYNKTRTEVCKDLGFVYSTFSDWLNAKKYPRIDKIEMMANYFHVSKANLVERQGASNLESNRLKGVQIPVLGRVVAGGALRGRRGDSRLRRDHTGACGNGGVFCLTDSRPIYGATDA